MRPGALHGKSILIIEDHTETANLMADILTDEGCLVRVSRSARDAYGLLATGIEPLPDAVLLDLGLPDMDGAEMFRMLQTSGRSVPQVLVASALPYAVVEQKARAIGAHGVLHKPFSIDELLDRLDRLTASA
jgi:DNA-binding response OmpR family regulator